MFKIKKQLFWSLLISVAFSQTGQSQTYIKPFIGLNAFNLSGQNCNSLQAGTSSVTNCYDGFTIINNKISPSFKYGIEAQKKMSADYYLNLMVANQKVKTSILQFSSNSHTYFQLNALNLNVALDRRISNFKIGIGIDLLYLIRFREGIDRFTREVGHDPILDKGVSFRFGYLIGEIWSFGLNLRKGLTKSTTHINYMDNDTLNPSNYAELTFGYRFEL